MNDIFDIGQFVDSDSEGSTTRNKCTRCKRPSSVCFCCALPMEQFELKNSKLIILQHPNEEHRPLNTSAVIEACLSPKSFSIHKGKRFNSKKFENLHKLVGTTNSFLLYPNENAISLEEMICLGQDVYNIVILDGTWKQAASIYAQNKFVQSLPKVKIGSNCVSEYIIRTQPTDQCLSTVECAAISLSYTEKNDSIKEMLMKPLRKLCEYQILNGAVIHHSKEYINKKEANC